MKARTLLELLTLSTNVYMISKDEKFMSNLREMAGKGKEKVAAMAAEFTGHDDEEKLMEKFFHKAQEAKEELDHKISEVAEKIYAKMNIAHRQELVSLRVDLEKTKKELALAEGRIIALETRKS